MFIDQQSNNFQRKPDSAGTLPALFHDPMPGNAVKILKTTFTAC
jgi:hypothetical protein